MLGNLTATSYETNIQDIRGTCRSGKEFDRFFEISKFSNFTAEEFDSYKNAEKMIWDYYNTIETATEEGEMRGLEKGREEGREETIAKLLAAGVDEEVISKALGVIVEDLRK